MASPLVTVSPTPLGLLAKARTVKKPESADTPRTPRTSGECQSLWHLGGQAQAQISPQSNPSCVVAVWAQPLEPQSHPAGQTRGSNGAVFACAPLGAIVEASGQAEPPCPQTSRLPQCRGQSWWQPVRCLSPAGLLRESMSSSDTCRSWVSAGTGQPPGLPNAKFQPQYKEHPTPPWEGPQRCRGVTEMAPAGAALPSLPGSTKAGSRAATHRIGTGLQRGLEWFKASEPSASGDAEAKESKCTAPPAPGSSGTCHQHPCSRCTAQTGPSPHSTHFHFNFTLTALLDQGEQQ